MTWMLRLYPRGWRRRYGAEVALLVAEERPTFRLFLDLLAGAIDARIHPQWIPADSPTKGKDAMTSIQRLCKSSGFSPAEERRGAVVMLAASLGFVLLALALEGWANQTLLSQALLYAAFPMAVILSTWGTYLKEYSQPVRWVLVLASTVGMFLFMLGVTYFADRF